MRPDKQLFTYNNRDCVVEADCFYSCRDELEEIGQLQFYREMVQPLAQAVYRMQERGMPIDEGRRQDAIEKKTARCAELREPLQKMAYLIGEEEFNPNANDQVGRLLKEMGFHSGRTTDKGKLKADKTELITALLKTADSPFQPVFSNIVDYRGEIKDIGTFLKPIVPYEDGRVRTSFLVTARTGRLQSRKWTTPWGVGPEFQNIPDDLRYIYVAPPGWVFINADAAQLELVIISNEAGVKAWLQAIDEGESIHIINMVNIMKVSKEEALNAKNSKPQDRRYITIKKFVFADNYWAELPTIQEQLLTESRILIPMQELEATMAAYRSFIPETAAWRDRVYPEALRTKQIWNRYGRLRRLFEEADKIRGISVNHPIQSTGADFINTGFIKLDALGLQLVNQVHDSVVLLCRREDRFAVRDMILEAFSHKIPINGKDVPIRMDIQWGESWGETTKF